jgi:hypothetical protein
VRQTAHSNPCRLPLRTIFTEGIVPIGFVASERGPSQTRERAMCTAHIARSSGFANSSRYSIRQKTWEGVGVQPSERMGVRPHPSAQRSRKTLRATWGKPPNATAACAKL